MDSTETRRLLRLALSHRENVQASRNECERAFATGAMDQAGYHAFRDTCRVHLEETEADLARLRALVQKELVRLGKELRATLDDQRRLVTSVSAGRTEPKKAGQAQRHLAACIEELRANIGEFNALHAAKSAQALGGFIDLPLAQYRDTAHEPAEAPKTPPRLRPKIRLSTSSILPVAIVLAGLAASGLLIARVMPAGGTVQFSAKVVPSSTHLIQLTCRNAKNRSIALFLPGAAEQTASHESAGESEAFSVALHVREQSGEPWRLLPSARGCWRRNGLPVAGQQHFTVAPGLSVDLTFDAQQLDGLGALPQAVKLEFLGSRGQVLNTFETDLRL